MSSLAFLVTELQSLASETRRRHPEIREAAEKSLAILRSSPEQATINLASDGPQSDDLLRPVFMGCATKNAKIVGISLGSLQRLIALKAVPQSAVPLIITTMSDAMSQGVDIQLRILQTLLSLITNLPKIHGDLLGDALLLCFKLQESRIAVVSSTAAATLRQLVMFVVDKVVAEDLRELPASSLVTTTLPDDSTQSLGPAARDAYAVFEDLCLLVNSEKPKFLNLESLHKTFALELIESVLTNYHELFRKHRELLLLLPHHLCPLLLKSLSERPIFPLTLRCTRVVFLLLKQFSSELVTESEVFLVLLIRIIMNDGDTASLDGRPGWMRVLCMEIMRGLCNDAELMRSIWVRYDAPALESHSGSKVFMSLITALKRLLTEKPALLGVGTQMFGIGVPSTDDAATSAAGMVAGMVVTAASGVVGMMGAGTGLSLYGSAMKLQCIDQLDKADAPPIPEAYLYLLGLQCVTSLCEGFSSFTGPIYTSLMVHRPRSAGDAPIRAPPALDLSSLPMDDVNAIQLRHVRAMVENGWPALLAALSFIIATNLSDELFVEVLGSYQAMTNVAGMLGLSTPRDAFLTSLAKFSIPTRVVSSLDSYIEPPTPRSAASLSENLGLSQGPTQPPGLSERNMACLKAFLSIAMFLAGSLAESWFGVLEVMQNADYVLTKGNRSSGATNKWSSPGQGSASRRASDSVSQAALLAGTGNASHSRHPLLSDLNPDSLLSSIQRLFDASKNLDDGAFRHFVNALCRLSAEMVGMQTGEETGSIIESSSTSLEETRALSPKTDAAHRRRVSGIHIPRTLLSGDFGINKLGLVAIMNVHRLVYRSPDVAWNATTTHLLSIIRLPLAPHSIRVQAARALDDILIVVPRSVHKAGELKANVQRRVLDVLAQQVILDPTLASTSSSTSVELRRMGLETLHQILQASGPLIVGWETIFEMLSSVCNVAPPAAPNSMESAVELSASPTKSKPPPLVYANEKASGALVKIAFQSLTLVCDSASVLSPDHLRLCITTLGQFGRQSDTNIALTAAESLLWGMSDAIQSKRKEADKEPEYSALWMSLLLEVLGLCTDARQEVRVGAIQTLFRAMQLYGLTLTLETWEEFIWKVTFPLLDSITNEIRQLPPSPAPPPQSDISSLSPEQAWNESKILALQSIGSIFHDFLATKIMHLDSFVKGWDVFVNHIEETVLLDHRTISAPALRCLEKAIKTSAAAGPDLNDRIGEAWQRVWSACDHIGDAVLQKAPTTSSPRPFTQESLVAFVDVIRSTRTISRRIDGAEWKMERLARLMAILRGILTYSSSPDYRPDVDGLTPVQAVVMDAISGIDLSAPESPSLVMRELSTYAALPFLASFTTPSAPPQQTTAVPKPKPQKRITYIAVFKKVMPLLVELFLQFKSKLEIYVDGTVESVLSAYSIPMKMKYDCPPASAFGKDPPLWKTATTHFLRVVKECTQAMKTLEQDLPDDRIEGIWQQILDVFRGCILADCSTAESFALDVQESEENFDLALLSCLEIDVVPLLGNPRIRDGLAAQLAKILLQGSRIYERDFSPFIEVGDDTTNGTMAGLSDDFERVDFEREYGSTDSGTLTARERFSYWCFDLLFLICSDTTKDQEKSRRRLAALSIPALLKRCRATLVGYVADESLRGNLPLPRAREDELLYVLRKLLDLRLWPGTLWSAFAGEPSKHCDALPDIDCSRSPSDIIADAVKRSAVAHLFHFYPVFCEIVSIPRRTPNAWVSSHAGGDQNGDVAATLLDARVLAKECLKLVGKEMAGEGWR